MSSVSSVASRAVAAPAQIGWPPLGAQAAGAQWHIQSDVWEWEPAFFDIYGLSAEEVVPSAPALLALKHPDDLAVVTTLLQAVPRGEEFSLTHRIFRHDGFVRLINTRSHIHIDPKGQPALLHAAVDVLSDWKLPLPAGDFSSANDGELMLCLRAQMPEAMAEAFRRHRNRMIGLVHNLYPAVDPEDIIQDVFEQLFREPHRFDARRGSLATYLSMQARSHCLDVGRSQTSRRRRQNASKYCDGGPSIEEEVLLGLTDLAVARLSPCFLHTSGNPLSWPTSADIHPVRLAKQLGIPEGTAKARIRRGLLRFRTDEGIGGSANADRVGQ